MRFLFYSQNYCWACDSKTRHLLFSAHHLKWNLNLYILLLTESVTVNHQFAMVMTEQTVLTVYIIKIWNWNLNINLHEGAQTDSFLLCNEVWILSYTAEKWECECTEIQKTNSCIVPSYTCTDTKSSQLHQGYMHSVILSNKKYCYYNSLSKYQLLRAHKVTSKCFHNQSSDHWYERYQRTAVSMLC